MVAHNCSLFVCTILTKIIINFVNDISLKLSENFLHLLKFRDFFPRKVLLIKYLVLYDTLSPNTRV